MPLGRTQRPNINGLKKKLKRMVHYVSIKVAERGEGVFLGYPSLNVDFPSIFILFMLGVRDTAT